jgi:hypothetical protein
MPYFPCVSHCVWCRYRQGRSWFSYFTFTLHASATRPCIHPIVLLHDLICFPRAPAPHILLQASRKLHMQSWHFPTSTRLCSYLCTNLFSGLLWPLRDIQWRTWTRFRYQYMSIDLVGLDVGTDTNVAIRPASQAPPRSLLS